MIPINIFAGPFGIDMGMTLDEVTKISKTKPISVGLYSYLITPPNTNDLFFEFYLVEIDEIYGVYFIKAIGKDISDTGYGDVLKLKFTNLSNNIEKNYGKYRTVDYLKRGSIWNEPEDFMMGLLKEDRALIVIWDKESKATLPNDIESIMIGVKAKTPSEGYLSLEYYSTKYDDIKKSREEKQNNVF
jgi:hypothetical protein